MSTKVAAPKMGGRMGESMGGKTKKARKPNAWAKAAGEYYNANKAKFESFSDVLQSEEFKEYYHKKGKKGKKMGGAYGDSGYRDSYKMINGTYEEDMKANAYAQKKAAVDREKNIRLHAYKSATIPTDINVAKDNIFKYNTGHRLDRITADDATHAGIPETTDLIEELKAEEAAGAVPTVVDEPVAESTVDNEAVANEEVDPSKGGKNKKSKKAKKSAKKSRKSKKRFFGLM